MRVMWNTVKYRLQCYFKGYTFVMPFIVICIFLRFMYSIKPQEIVSSYLVSVQVLFLIMVWVGMMEINRENRVMEQIIELRVRKTWVYFAGKMLFLFILSIFMATICMIWPFVQNVIEHGTFFERKYIPEDFLNSFILLLGSSFSGVMLGALFHPDIFKDRKVAIALTVLLALLADIREIVVSSQPILKYVLWPLPNIAYAAMQYGNEEYFKINLSLCYFLILMVYAVTYGIIGSFLQYKRRA